MLPEAKVLRREPAGVPRVEVIGLSKEKVEETFWDAITQIGSSWRASRGNNLLPFVQQMERNGHGASTSPPG